MNGKILSGEALLINDKLTFKCTAGEKEPIIVDYLPPAGDGRGVMSLELLLLSLASCLGSSVKVLVSNYLKKVVRSLRIQAKGTRRETHPTSFESISLQIHLEADGVDEEAMDGLIEKVKEICPVYVMLKASVQISIDYQLI